MVQTLRKIARTYTYADYQRWPDEERWELIDGAAHGMTPAPGRAHQECVGELFRLFANHLQGKPCKVIVSPFDVRLPAPGEVGEGTSSVVQPDIVVVCDPAKLDDKGCIGAPDLVVEVLSPATAAKDLREKFALYERHGVLEYWVAQPVGRLVMVFKLAGGAYGRPEVFAAGERIPVGVIPGLEIDLATVFPVEPAPGEQPGPTAQ